MSDTFAPETDDERLCALLDGELSPAEADRLRARIAADPALAARYDAMRRSDGALRAALASGDDEPMPAGVTTLLNDRARVLRPTRATAWAAATSRRFAPVPLAIAASVALVVGFLLAQLWPLQVTPDGTPPALVASATVADGTALHDVLTDVPSGGSVTLAGAVVTPRLSFRQVDGHYCRVVDVLDGTSLTQAVVCRDGRDWRVAIAGFGAAPDAEVYRPASAAVGAIDRALAAMIDGAPLGRDEELDLLGRDWAD